MKILLQKLRITLASFLFLLFFGILLSFLSYYVNEASNFTVIGILGLILGEILLFYTWLNRLHRELMVLKYRKFKKEND
jgi:xanthosine utilization system XapX-like protein